MFANAKIPFDTKTELQGYLWKDEGVSPKGVVYLAHGMAEYLARYDGFAEYLVKNGYTVIGCDYYAHGLSVQSPKDVGVVNGNDFMETVMSSITLTVDFYKEEIKDLPLYVFAHSMGSMVMQRYLQLYPSVFKKAVICGTDNPGAKYKLMEKITSIAIKKHGEISYLKFIENLGCGSFSKKFKNEGKNAWLSTDKSNVVKYTNDELCGRQFPTNYYNSLSKLMYLAGKQENIRNVAKDVKIFVVAGEKDPVGGMGKGPKALYKKYLKCGVDAKLKLYSGARHEILNESKNIKEEVYQDVLNFYNN